MSSMVEMGGRFAISLLGNPRFSESFLHGRPECSPDPSPCSIPSLLADNTKPTMKVGRVICGDGRNRTAVQRWIRVRSTWGRLLHLVSNIKIQNRRKLLMLYPRVLEGEWGGSTSSPKYSTAFNPLDKGWGHAHMRAYALAYANWKSFIPKYGEILAKESFAVEFWEGFKSPLGSLTRHSDGRPCLGRSSP